MYPTATKLQWEMAPLYYGGNVYTAGFYLGTQNGKQIIMLTEHLFPPLLKSKIFGVCKGCNKRAAILWPVFFGGQQLHADS